MISFQIDLTGLETALSATIADLVEDKMTDIFTDLTAPPPLGTPVDSGNARNGWQLDTSIPLHPEITNSVPYINRLNDGHSKQSPAGYIDAVIDKHTR